MTSMPWLELRSVGKRFGEVAAVDSVDLSIRRGEFLTLLGASGCGKSTTLRLIAGLDDVDSGQILLDGRPIHDMPAHRRETAMVFQSYALFPHMTVRQNVAFGLEARRVERRDIGVRVEAALRLVELDAFGARYPRQLSGGQQQRVALARAIVTEPKALLLDEPLSNLDAKLRDRLRVELRALQQKRGVTTIYVTHDQGEAMSLSDRVVFMAGGRIVEIGTPQDIYQRPRFRSTAEFLGIANLLEARVAATAEGAATLDTPLGRLVVDSSVPVASGETVLACFRPEDIHLGASKDTAQTAGRIAHAAYLGAMTDYVVELSGGLSLRVHVPGAPAWSLGDQVAVALPRRAALIRSEIGRAAP